MLAGLILAYRTLGGTAARPVDAGVALRAGHDATAAASTELARILDEGAPPGGGPAHPGRTALQGLRRRLDAAAQSLERIDVTSLDEPRAGAHALIAVAADELGWAVRLCAAPAYGSSAGMQGAADALRAHAETCLRDGAALLDASAAPEEVERSR